MVSFIIKLSIFNNKEPSNQQSDQSLTDPKTRKKYLALEITQLWQLE
jgi:hypothetical protein